jgi:hypothetical protein
MRDIDHGVLWMSTCLAGLDYLLNSTARRSWMVFYLEGKKGSNSLVLGPCECIVAVR